MQEAVVNLLCYCQDPAYLSHTFDHLPFFGQLYSLASQKQFRTTFKTYHNEDCGKCLPRQRIITKLWRSMHMPEKGI